MQRCDFLVVGAGIAGASVAYWLAPYGSVTILEAEEQPGYHTTGRSAAFFWQAYGNATIRRLSAASRFFFEHPPAAFSEAPLLSDREALLIARSDQMDLLETHGRVALELMPSARMLSAAEVVDRVSALRVGYAAGGVLEPDARDIDVNALHQGFLRGARAGGATLVCNAETEWVDHIAGQWRVQTRTGMYSAPVILNAAGAWADEFGSLAGAEPVGLIPKRRTAFTFDTEPSIDFEDWPAVIDVAEEFYFKPEAGKLLGSPADETPSPPCDAQPEEIDVAIAVDRISKAVTFQIPKVERKWAGLRNFVEDKTPAVGFDREVEGFFWLAGQGGYGIQTSPALGRVASCLVRGEALPSDLVDLGVSADALSPDRLRSPANAHASVAAKPASDRAGRDN